MGGLLTQHRLSATCGLSRRPSYPAASRLRLSVQTDRLCKFMDVRNQQCDLDLISILCFRCGSYLVFYFQGRVGWLVVGELLSLVTFPVFVGLFEWLGQVYLDIGVYAEFLLATRAILPHLALKLETVNIKTLVFSGGRWKRGAISVVVGMIEWLGSPSDPDIFTLMLLLWIMSMLEKTFL